MDTANYFVIVPNHLPHLDFLDDWAAEFRMNRVQVIVVQDFGQLDKASFDDLPEYVHVYSRQRIAAALPTRGDSWIIPQRTSACRSFGHWAAWREWVNQGRDPDTIFLTLDNDCYPEGVNYWLSGHRQMLDSSVTLDWVNTMGEHHARGFPYGIRGASQVMLNHGLWSNVPDLDGASMLLKPDLRLDPVPRGASMKIPRWSFFPMCGMNLAWRPALTPALYFGLFGPDYGFDQYDDIWAGVLVKKVLDHLGYGVRSGYPSVEHRKQSNAFDNLVKQAPGLKFNELFWKIVADAELTTYPGHDEDRANVTGEQLEALVIATYRELIEALPNDWEACPRVPAAGPSRFYDMPWLTAFKEAALLWLDLFQ